MKGDFSHRALDPQNNYAGVLQQQGRVLLDRDWNDQTSITRHWQDQAGRDVIGADIAAVPSGDQDGFAISGAAVVGGQVELQVNPGRIWADGIVCYLPDPAPVTRVADYFQPPIQDPAADVSTIADGVRDAVVLEVSHEELNAFQVPDELLEPALGGPDTTERIQTRAAFKLFRLASGEDCHSIGDRLDDDSLGHLTVQLQPTVVIPGDCPLVLGGGYTGFEHFLYRIEIAALDAATPPHFKWSRFNGGLVGRGELLATPNRIRITANRPAIVNSGLNAFYCEVVVFDAARGVWNVTFGADVTLIDGELHIGTERLGSFAAATDTVFFRLWDGIMPVSDFTNTATPVELLDGIRLIFDAPATANFVAGNYWTFQVRTGENANPPVLIDDRLPEGPAYHRVALAEITWGDPVEIEDCRRRFRPLTQLDTCCTFRVGDGIHSHGDFTSIQQAIDVLPARGGEVCVLPGVFLENIQINNRENITISGCGARSLIRSRRGTGPVIWVRGGANITIESLAIESAPRGGGIVLEGASYLAAENVVLPLVGATLSQLLVLGGQRAAVRASYVTGLTVRGCRLHQRDATSLQHTLMLRVDDALIAENVVEVGLRSTALHGEPGGEWAPLPYLGPGSSALGGIHVQGMSERIQIINNFIRGGSGHGITLGSLRAFNDDGEPQPDPDDDPNDEPPDPCEPTREVPGILHLFPIGIIGAIGQFRIFPDGPIEELLVARNRIYQMGTCGIGVFGFFDLRAADVFVTVRKLAILGNDIRGNMRRPVAQLPDALVNAAGFGGISLADVENLVVHDNLIVQNGASNREAICGIFVLHGEGVDISRNRISDNGRGDEDTQADAKKGIRGGIVLVYALAPTRLIRVAGTRVPSGMVPEQNGVPAAKIHDNIVVQPLGPALLVTALGPVSVLDNQLTSQGASRGLTASFLAATVCILNLGLSNELYLQYLVFRAAVAASFTGDVPLARPGLDDLVAGHALANGLVLFANNQVTMDVIETGITLAISSILILTLDDLGFHDNQCVANTLDDIILSQALLFGLSTRVTGNRFTEGLFNAVLSALTLGLFMNTTTDNQGTHCILALGNRLVRFPNTSLYGGVELGTNQESRCDAVRRVILAFLDSLSRSQPQPGLTTVPSNQLHAVNLVKNPQP